MVVFVTVTSCNDITHVNDNIKEFTTVVREIITKETPIDFIQKKKIGEFIYTASYRPSDLIAKYEYESGTISHRDPEELEQCLYFQLDIEHETFADELLKYNVFGYSQYDERVKYFSFNMMEDIYIITGRDTIPCGLHHFERNFSIGNKITVMLAFPISSNIIYDDVTLQYHDNSFNNGIVKLYFRKELFKPVNNKS